MGAGSSVQTKEVSFINKKTGHLYPEEEIKKINDEVFKDFKYGFYSAYKSPNAYTEYKFKLENGLIK